jgi:hypothetical protein
MQANACGQIRMSNFEIRNKSQNPNIRMTETEQRMISNQLLVIWISVIQLCFGFRASDFGFSAFQQGAKMFHRETPISPGPRAPSPV